MIDVRIIKSLRGSILSGVNYLHLIVCPRPSLWVSPRSKNRVGLAQRRVRQRKWNWNLASGGQTGPTAGGRENLNWRQNTEYIGSQSLSLARPSWGMSASGRWEAGWRTRLHDPIQSLIISSQVQLWFFGNCPTTSKEYLCLQKSRIRNGWGELCPKMEKSHRPNEANSAPDDDNWKFNRCHISLQWSTLL